MKIIIAIPDSEDVRHYAAALSAADIVRRYDGASMRIEKDNGAVVRWYLPRASGQVHARARGQVHD